MSKQKIEDPKIIDPDYFIVEHLIIQKGVPIGEDTDEVTVVEEYIESKRYPRQEFINSFRGDVGILNILKKVRATGNVELLNQRQGQYLDISYLPSDVGDAYNIVENARKLFETLPEDLRGKMDFKTFCETMDQKKFDEYIASKQPKVSEEAK